MKIWPDARIDIIQVVVEESHKRGLEDFYTYRINQSDREEDGSPARIALKDQYPEWLLDGVWSDPGF